MSTVVVDASIAVGIASSPSGLVLIEGRDAVAPGLLWPEVRSALHVSVVRKLTTRETADLALDVLYSGVIKERRHRDLGRVTWQIADELGWAKTYDAEYLALARLLNSPLATLDQRMARAAERLGLQLDERLR